MKILHFFYCCIGVLTIACTPQKKDTSQWYKGNLHTHSYWSDGDEYPEMIMDWYKSHGYDFIALSDHNILAEGEKWITVTKSRMYEEGFQKYLEKYGDDWVAYKLDSGRAHVKLKTYSEYRPLFEDNNFLIIQSEEVTDRYQDKPIHMNVTNVPSVIDPQGGNSVTEVMQRNVDAVLQLRKQTGRPMFPHINHPNFYNGISIQDIIDLRGEQFFEVYNGHPMVRNYGDSTHPGTEEMWDKINLAYLERNQPLLYGLATDDSHNYHQFGSAYSNAGRGWVMVKADSLTPTSLVHAMERGSFYATTGVVLNEVAVSGEFLTVSVAAQPGVNYNISFIGAVKGNTETRVLSEVAGPDATFKITKDLLFVRARITSDKLQVNPFQEYDVEKAWTQPVVYAK
jgi:hypothetical protein